MKDLSNIGAERRASGQGQTIRCTAVALFSFYVFAGLLNGTALQRDIELMPYGKKRDICVALIKPVAWLSRQTHLGDARTWLEQHLHKGESQ